MTIDWNFFTPWSSLFGGMLLGLAAAMFVLINGRVLGISGILGGLLIPKRGDMSWRIFFLAGLLLSPLAFTLVANALPLIESLHQTRIDASLGTVLLAGVLVGLGTRYAAGCTSGHGVCGLSRFSPRSLVATVSFMAAGFVTVGVARMLTA